MTLPGGLTFALVMLIYFLNEWRSRRRALR